MDRPLKETVYTPDSELLSFGRLLRNMGTDLLAARELAWRLLVRNLSAQYRQGVPDGERVSLVVFDGELETLVDRTRDHRKVLDAPKSAPDAFRLALNPNRSNSPLEDCPNPPVPIAPSLPPRS